MFLKRLFQSTFLKINALHLIYDFIELIFIFLAKQETANILIFHLLSLTASLKQFLQVFFQ